MQTTEFELNRFADDYLDTKSTSFKYILTVSNTPEEKKYYEGYLKALDEEKKKMDPTPTPTTNNTFSNNTNSGFGFGNNTNSNFGFGTNNTNSNNTNSNFSFNFGNQQQTQQQGLTGYTENGNKATIDLFFFHGLEHRLEYQKQQQENMKERLDTINEEVNTLMKEIETTIISKYSTLQKKAIEIDKRIISQLSQSGNINATLISKFRDLSGKMEITDIQRKTNKLLNILQNRKMVEGQVQDVLSEESRMKVIEMLNDQQKLIVKFVGEINDLQGKYQNLKSTFVALNESK